MYASHVNVYLTPWKTFPPRPCGDPPTADPLGPTPQGVKEPGTRERGTKHEVGNVVSWPLG